MERSLVLVKPYAVQRGLGGTFISRLENLGLKMVALKMLHLDRALAEQLYAVHRSKPFFADLVSYVTSEPVIAAVFQGERAVEILRRTIGATDPAKAEPGTIRRDYGMDVRRNAIHGSDSVESAEREIKLFFAEKEIFSEGK